MRLHNLVKLLRDNGVRIYMDDAVTVIFDSKPNEPLSEESKTGMEKAVDKILMAQEEQIRIEQERRKRRNKLLR